MRHADNQARTIAWLVGLFVGAIVLAVPTGYAYITYRYMTGSVESEVEVIANALMQNVISRNPVHWEFEKVRLDEYFSHLLTSGKGERGRILNRNNDVVAETANALANPVIKVTHELKDAGASVGQVEVTRSFRPVLVNAGLISMITVPVGLGLFSIFWFLSIRSLYRAQNLVEESEERYRRIFNQVGDVIYTVEPDGTFSAISPSCERILGWSPDEWIGRPFLLIVHPDDLPSLQALSVKAQAGEVLPAFQVRVLTKVGGYLETEVTVNLVRRDHSFVVLGVLRDITGRKQAEVALRKSRDLLQSVVEHVPARIFWKDRESRYLGCNILFAKDAGHTRPDELIGKTDFEMGWRDQAELYRADDKATMESGRPKLDYEEPQTTPDGHTIWLRTSKVPLRDPDNQVIGILGLYQDITDQKNANEAIKKSEARYRSYIEVTGQLAWVTDADGAVVEDLPTWRAFTGQSEKQVKGWGWAEAVHPDDRERAAQAWREAVARKGAYEVEYRMLRHDGIYRDFFTRGLPVLDTSGSVREWVGTSIDITELKRAEQALREREEMLDKIATSAQDAILMLDSDGNIALWNAAAEKIFGYSSKEALGKNLHLLLAPARFHDAHRAAFGRFTATGEGAVVGKTLELAALRKDGSEFPMELSLSSVKLKDQWHAVGIVRDITARKKSEEEQKLFRALLDYSIDAIEVLNPDTFQFLDTNQKAYRALGYSREELLSLSAFDIDPTLERSKATEMMQGLRKSGSLTHEGRHRRKDGTEFPVEVTLGYVQLDRDYMVSVVRDITTRKQAEQALERANRALRTLSACNGALVHDEDEAALLASVCRLIVETGGYRMAWVGFHEQGAAKTVRPVAHYGHENGYLATGKIDWANDEFSRNPFGTAIRTGVAQVSRISQSAPTPWREAAQQRGYQTSIVLPLLSSAGTLGVLSIYAAESEAFDEAEVKLLQELASDLAFGIVTLRMRTEHDRITNENLNHSEVLRQSLEDSVKAIASTVEMRDPYTAGHQRRVGQLSVAIARELGLPEHTIRGLELAASIHDLGKISVPAEILAKPSKLTAIESMLLQNHAQAGYDILKDIKFPWPIATMVWQHHERMDGSGYPQGLKGDAILLESRILAVADVAEAMASHRPYRAALGVDSALKELERGRGTVYDGTVVDACMQLFAENRFAFLT